MKTLTIKYAAYEKTRGYLERMIGDLTGKQEKNKKKKPPLSVSKYLLSKQTVMYICLTCLESDNIPLDVVEIWMEWIMEIRLSPHKLDVKAAVELCIPNTTKGYMAMNTT
ncbi:hypothetical protein [Paenibacillus foliorum]|uniref:hypothetical protein n=1 Tax=Paenibacillus foliorum TaxID=2654974 RepID=UPI001492DD10|nr:hypothetical protein [Paenibacillus foliorum]